MHLAADYVRPFKGFHGFRSKCCIRIYEPEDESDAPMVICSELADNLLPITNAAELASRWCRCGSSCVKGAAVASWAQRRSGASIGKPGS